MMPKNTAHMSTIHCMPLSQCARRDFRSPSEILRATNLRTSSSSTTGTENFITVTHSSTDSGVTWNTAYGQSGVSVSLGQSAGDFDMCQNKKKNQFRNFVSIFFALFCIFLGNFLWIWQPQKPYKTQILFDVWQCVESSDLPRGPLRIEWRSEGWKTVPLSRRATYWTRAAWWRETGSRTSCS